ncbi:MAG: acetylxylan esterase [Thermoguttaceae bacterium]|nr:acetylxylan esterase [Thermoguttaceae bacterium]
MTSKSEKEIVPAFVNDGDIGSSIRSARGGRATPDCDLNPLGVCTLAAVLRKLVLALSGVFLFCAGLSAAEVRFVCDRADQVCHVGESAAVTMTVLNNDGEPVEKGTLCVRITNDGGEILDRRDFDLAESNPAAVNVSLSFPGHALVKATASGEGIGEDVHRLFGLSFDPQRIEPGLPKPDDFDRFWAEGKAEVRQIPLDAEMTPIPELTTETREVFQVGFATLGGERVYGFLSKPVGEGPFPALVNVPGAGPGTGPDLTLTDRGFAVLVMNVFPYPVPLNEAERKKQHKEFNKSLGVRYCYFHSNDRGTYYFRSVYLGIDRAIDWFAAQPFTDHRIGFFGMSQGGGSALILSALNRNIKAAVASEPAICDHAGGLKGRSPGWPRLVAQAKGDPEVLNASRYLDGVNFAGSIEIPIRVIVGFIDVTCSPSSVWSAYNAIPSADKEMLLEQKLGHQYGEKYQQALDWLCETVGKM